MQINVLALEGVFDTGLSIVLDALATANELSAMQGVAIPQWNVSVVGVRRRVVSAQQLVRTKSWAPSSAWFPAWRSRSAGKSARTQGQWRSS